MPAAVRRPKPGQSSGSRTTSAEPCKVDAARLLELMPGLFAYLDPDLRYVEANEAYAGLRGHDRASIVGLHYRDVVGEANFCIIRNRLERALSGERVDFEYDLLTPDGKKRVMASYRPDCGPDGELRGVLASIIDLTLISERHRWAVEKEALLEDAFLNAPIGISVADTLGKIIRANESFARMLGRTQAELVGMSYADITHPDDVDADIEHFREVLRGKTNGYRLDKRYIRADGSAVEALLSVSAMRNAAGEIVCFVSHALDVTERRQAARALQTSNAQLSLAMEVVRGGFWHLELAAGHFQISRQLSEFVTGPDCPLLDLADYVARIPEEDLAAADLRPLIEGREDRAAVHYRLLTVNGPRWMRSDRRLIRDAAGQPTAVVGVVIDITEEHEQLQRSREQADTDSLTGLLNRRGLQHRLEDNLAARPWVALVIDLDGFKKVNDLYGHAAGDLVLIESARRMLGAVRDGDIVGRTGGDEFVIILPGADRALLDIVAARLIEAVRQPTHYGEQQLRVSCSIGAVLVASGHSDLAEALKEADAALYQAKASGKDTWRVY